MGDSDGGLPLTEPLDEGAARQLRLLVWEPGGRSLQVPLQPGTFTIGRLGTDAEIQLDDPAASRRHAQLLVDEVLEVVDLASSNGTVVRGKRVAPHRHVTIAIDEPWVVGATTLIIRRMASVTGARVTGDVFAADTRALAQQLAGVPTDALIVGEPGVGKTELARWLHQRSGTDGQLVEVNCRGASTTELEAQLLGGADAPGAFAGTRGTVVLDDLTEMPVAMQTAVIRELDQRPAASADAARLRVIGTSRIQPGEAVRMGVLHKDLRYRLGAVTFELDPLRERQTDLTAVTDALLAAAVRNTASAPRRLSDASRAWIAARPWHGNLRELASVLTAAVAASRAADLEPEDLDRWANADGGGGESERDRIAAVLASCGGNQSQAARELGISRGTLVARIKKYGLVRPRKR